MHPDAHASSPSFWLTQKNPTRTTISKLRLESGDGVPEEVFVPLCMANPKQLKGVLPSTPLTVLPLVSFSSVL